MTTDAITIHRVVGDTLTPISVVLANANGDPVSLSGKTVTFELYDTDSVAAYAASSADISSEVTQAFTATANSVFLSCVGHRLKVGQQILLTTTGTLPAGLATSTRYFVRKSAANHFTLATMADGDVITPTSAGTGTHSFAVVGQTQWAPTSGAVDTAGTFYGCFRVTSGGAVDTFPGNEKRLKIILEARP